MAENVSRRHFLASVAFGGVGANTALGFGGRHRRCQPVPCSLPPFPIPPEPCDGLRVRPNILSLTPVQLASLKRGIAVMKSLPAADRRSWTFQAAIHGTPDDAAAAKEPLFRQCVHTKKDQDAALEFLPWHRAFLHFFERILRWAANDPGLMLPFWDWTAHPFVPEPYRFPADPVLNPLYEPSRQANDGRRLSDKVVRVDAGNGLDTREFASPDAPGFSEQLENSPHGNVHDEVGGENGLMGSVPTAAGDPIFWVHHANVDRLWDVWLNRGGGRTNPVDSSFLGKTYTFADETGGTSAVTVRDIISSARLGYRYEGVPAPAVQPVAEQPPKPAGPRVVATSGPPDRGEEDLSKLPAKPLGFKEERVPLSTIKGARPALTQALPGGTPAGRPPRVVVAVEGLAADRVSGIIYGVYVNLPPGERSDDVLERHYVGSINFFGKTRSEARKHGHGHGAGGDEFSARFDATKVVAGLSRAGKLDLDQIVVTILPITATPPGATQEETAAKAAAKAERNKVSYRRVSVRVVPPR